MVAGDMDDGGLPSLVETFVGDLPTRGYVVDLGVKTGPVVSGAHDFVTTTRHRQQVPAWSLDGVGQASFQRRNQRHGEQLTF